MTLGPPEGYRLFARDVACDPPVVGMFDVQDALAALVGASGAQITRKFPFSLATPGLDAGATIYTPTAGDILHECWVQVDVAFDGTTPFGDVGTFVGANTGLFNGLAAAPLDMTQADTVLAGAGITIGNNGPSMTTLNALLDAIGNLSSGPGLNPADLISSASLTSLATVGRVIPAAFPNADPIKVCVSQTGQVGGAAVGGTVGSGVVYLVTSTPV
jgi:hypothetical protein